MKPRGLFIVPADYDALRSKGLDEDMLRRDEGGFLGTAVVVHALASRTRVVELPCNNVIYEVGLDFLPGLRRSRLLRLLLAPIHLLRVVHTASKLIRTEHLNFIRAHDPYWMGLIGLVVSRITRIPFCVSIHADYGKLHQLTGGGGTYTLFGWRRPADLVCHWVLSRAKLVLPIRASLAQWAARHGADPNRVRIIPHGIDMRPFCRPPNADIRRMLDIRDSLPLVSFAGRLSKENYVRDVVETAARLAARGYDFRLVIAGSGECEAELKQLVEDRRLTSKVLFVGSLPRQHVIDLRRASAASLCLMGGFSLIEACAAGSAVVAYDVEWHSELVINGQTGFLVEEGDVDGVAEAVSRLLSDGSLAERLGNEGRRIAMARHDQAIASAAKCRCYVEMVERGSI